MGEGAAHPADRNWLDAIYQDIQHAVDQTVTADGKVTGGSHHGDHYVTKGVNWDGYELNALVSMVATPADPSQVDAVAGLWRSHGTAITQGADNLTKSLTTLLNYWQGTAADQAAQAVTASSNWVAAVGDTAGKLADSIEDAGGALRSAQSTMPTLTAGAGSTPDLSTAAGSAAIGAAMGGPFGAASGAVIGGLSSSFAAADNNNQLKQQAVQTMQRYETAAVTIDTGTPQFVVPAGVNLGTANSLLATGGTGVGVGSTALNSTATGQSSFDSTLPSFAADPTGRWNALTGGSGGLGGLGGLGAGAGKGGLAGLGAGGLGGFGGFGTSRSAADAESERLTPGSASGTAANEAAGVAGRSGGGSGVLEDVDRPAGEPMGGMAGGQGARKGGDEREHRRRIPFEDEPFVTGLKAVPAVIGLSALAREDDA